MARRRIDESMPVLEFDLGQSTEDPCASSPVAGPCILKKDLVAVKLKQPSKFSTKTLLIIGGIGLGLLILLRK